jgi:peptide chain release factor 2
MLLQELQETTAQLLQDGEKYELELLLSGPYDHAPARITLTAGAGGTEANDWVADLKRMYERHASKMGFTCTIEDSQDGDVVGYKSVDMLITGSRAYGWFQGEKGAHRLVRLSPFNANNKRQTTFAGVDVAPEILNEDDLKEITIPDKDIEITTMRSGGSGGQNVNKVDSAVRIKHLPSGLQVKCTQERSQSMNKEIAMKRLKGQLLAIAKEQRVKEIKEIRGDMVEASWGAQIRNYVLHPYKMVKDQRTGWETSNAQAFLDGELLDDCIGAYLRYKVEKEESDES